MLEAAPVGDTHAWDEFRAAYPRKTKLEPGCRAYVSRIDSPEEHERLMAGLGRHLRSQDWLDEHGELKLKFIPPMDRFIMDGLYLDDPPEWKPPVRQTTTREDAITAALERRAERRATP